MSVEDWKAGPLPSGWEARTDSGKPYYIDHFTKTTWDDPQDPLFEASAREPVRDFHSRVVGSAALSE